MRRILFTLFALLLSGCAVGPDYKPVTWSFMPRTWLNGGNISDTAPVANLAWWQPLHDEQLNALVAQALLNNGDLKVAKARVEEARGARLTAQAGMLPQIEGSATGKRGNSGTGRINATGNIFDAGFDSSWELDIFGGGRRAAEAARATLQSRRASERQVRISLLAEVVRTYVDLRRIESQITLTEENLKVQTYTLEVVHAQQEEGVASLLDVSRVEGQTTQTESMLPDLKTQRATLRNNLAVLAGLAPAEVISFTQPAPIPHVSSSVMVGLPATVIANRPDVQVAERDLAAATANKGVALSNWFPQVSLSALFGMEKGLGLPAFDTWNAGGTIKLPLIDFGRVRGMVRQASAKQQEALAVYEQTVKAALADVESSMVAYQQSQDKVRILTKTAAATRKAEEIASVQYKEGIIGILDVLQAQQQRLSAEMSLAEAQANAVQRYAALYKALGGGAYEK